MASRAARRCSTKACRTMGSVTITNQAGTGPAHIGLDVTGGDALVEFEFEGMVLNNPLNVGIIA